MLIFYKDKSAKQMMRKAGAYDVALIMIMIP